MALDVYFKEDIRAHILSGLMLAIQVAQQTGHGNTEFVRGIVANSQHTALGFQLPWEDMLNDARLLLGDDLTLLLDSAINNKTTIFLNRKVAR